MLLILKRFWKIFFQLTIKFHSSLYVIKVINKLTNDGNDFAHLMLIFKVSQPALEQLFEVNQIRLAKNHLQEFGVDMQQVKKIVYNLLGWEWTRIKKQSFALKNTSFQACYDCVFAAHNRKSRSKIFLTNLFTCISWAQDHLKIIFFRFFSQFNSIIFIRKVAGWIGDRVGSAKNKFLICCQVWKSALKVENFGFRLLFYKDFQISLS